MKNLMNCYCNITAANTDGIFKKNVTFYESSWPQENFVIIHVHDHAQLSGACPGLRLLKHTAGLLWAITLTW